MKKKRSGNIYQSRRASGGLSRAKILVYLETQEDSKCIYQNFRLVASDIRLLSYFIDEKFLGYYILDKEMSKYYAGDGEKIIFRTKVYFNNLISVTFDKLDKDVKIRDNIDNAQFSVEAPVPATQGCIDCEYFRKSNRMCSYYQEMGIKVKKNCYDFKQKEVQHG